MVAEGMVRFYSSLSRALDGLVASEFVSKYSVNAYKMSADRINRDERCLYTGTSRCGLRKTDESFITRAGWLAIRK